MQQIYQSINLWLGALVHNIAVVATNFDLVMRLSQTLFCCTSCIYNRDVNDC